MTDINKHATFKVENYKVNTIKKEDIMLPEIDENKFKYDKAIEGWELQKNVGLNLTLASIAQLKLVPFLREDEEHINGEELIYRAKTELNVDFGQLDAEFLLKYQHIIPEEFRDYYLVFSGTIWCDKDEYIYIASLHWHHERWHLCLCCLADNFGKSARLICLGE